MYIYKDLLVDLTIIKQHYFHKNFKPDLKFFRAYLLGLAWRSRCYLGCPWLGLAWFDLFWSCCRIWASIACLCCSWKHHTWHHQCSVLCIVGGWWFLGFFFGFPKRRTRMRGSCMVGFWSSISSSWIPWWWWQLGPCRPWQCMIRCWRARKHRSQLRSSSPCIEPRSCFLVSCRIFGWRSYHSNRCG